MSLDENMDVGEDDEGRCQAGPGVVLRNQVVALKLPVGITLSLYLGEGIAADRKNNMQ